MNRFSRNVFYSVIKEPSCDTCHPTPVAEICMNSIWCLFLLTDDDILLNISGTPHLKQNHGFHPMLKGKMSHPHWKKPGYLHISLCFLNYFWVLFTTVFSFPQINVPIQKTWNVGKWFDPQHICITLLGWNEWWPNVFIRQINQFTF